MAGPAVRVVVKRNLFVPFNARMQQAVRGVVGETLSAIAYDVKGGGPNAAPIITGNLRRSYHISMDDDGMSGTVGNDPGIAHYAIYVEMGTRRMSARPHLVPALEAQVEPFKQNIGKALEVTE